jgi:YVTN family beta-propeller protein
VVVAVDPVSGGTLYAANGSFLHFVSAASGAITATLEIPDIASLFPSPDGSRLVALTFFGDVIVVNTLSRTPVATLALGVISDVAVRNANGTRLYVADATTIRVVDLTGPTLAATIPMGINPRKLVLSGDGRKLLALNPGDTQLVVIDTTTNTVVTTLSLGGVLRDVAASPTRPRAYVADETTNSIRVVNTDTSSVVGTMPLSASPTRLAVSPDGARLFVVQAAVGVVTAVDAQADVTTTSVTLHPPLGEIAVAPNGRAFVQELEGELRARQPLAVVE